MKVCWYLLKLGDNYILFKFVYVWIFHNKKWKRKTHWEFEHINCQPNRGPGQVGQRCEEQLSDGHKEGTLCLLSKLDRPIMLSSNTWTFSGGFFIGITIHCSIWPCSSGWAGWSREGVLNKVVYLCSRVSQSAHYWYFQFSSVAQLCPTLCDPMDCSMPGLPVHHQFPEPAQSHVYQLSDAIQLSHPLSSLSPAFSLSQHQDIF